MVVHSFAVNSVNTVYEPRWQFTKAKTMVVMLLVRELKICGFKLNEIIYLVRRYLARHQHKDGLLGCTIAKYDSLKHHYSTMKALYAGDVKINAPENKRLPSKADWLLVPNSQSSGI